MRTTHTIALALASLACAGKGRGMQNIGRSREGEASNPSRALTMLVFAFSPAVGWHVSAPGHCPDFGVNLRSCAGRRCHRKHLHCLRRVRRQPGQGVLMAVVDDASGDYSPTGPHVFFQPGDIPSLLQEEPNWDLFAEDLVVVDRTDAKVSGQRPNMLLLKMLRGVSKQYVEDVRVELVGSAPNNPPDSSDSFMARLKVQLGTVLVAGTEVPVDLEVDTVFHYNDESKVDSVRIDKWLVNGNEWIQSSPVTSMGSLMEERLQKGRPQEERQLDRETSPALESGFVVRADYDYERSTAENYAAKDENMTFFGKHTKIREQLDYTYHTVYLEERQLLQDVIIKEFLNAEVSDAEFDMSCQAPTDPWIVFTAGAMGAGKSHAINWLHDHDYFPLDAFVTSDPDQIRDMLPETREYNLKDSDTCGERTQKEANYIAEILTETALQEGKNIIVDGSLRDHEWYDQYFKKLRRRYPGLKIAIIHVHASPDVVRKRAAARAKVTGRAVPSEVIMESINQLPISLKVLVPQTDFFAKLQNEGPSPELATSRAMSSLWR